MKKKILGILAVLIVTLISAWNINKNQNEVNLSDLALNNVEALAWHEEENNNGGGTQYYHYNYKHAMPNAGGSTSYICGGSGIINC